MEKALNDTKTPLTIAEECLMQREGRSGIDLVHDNVERALTKVSNRHMFVIILKVYRTDKMVIT